jgi:PAS domain S-box-containing protein
MKKLSGKKFYAVTVPVIFITLMGIGKLLALPGEAMRYRELLLISAMVSATIYLLIEKNKYRRNDLAFVSKPGRQTPEALTPSDFFLVTSKAKHKQQLINTEERYRLLIQNSTDVITLIDGNGIITYQSPALEKITGFSPKELNGKNIFDYIHPQDISRVSKELLFGIFKEGKTSQLISHRFKHKNGSWVNIESHGTSHLNMQGINGIIINSRDVTERENNRHQLEDANAQLKTLFENVHEAFVSIDLVHHCVLQISPAHGNIYGRSAQEFYDNVNLWREVIHPDDQYLVPGMYQSIQSGVPFTTEYRIIKKDGTIRWIEHKITSTLNHQNRLVRMDAVISDITVRKESEERIKEQFRALQKPITSSTILCTASRTTCAHRLHPLWESSILPRLTARPSSKKNTWR